MSNRTSAVLRAVSRRKRSVASVVSVGAIGALALGTLGTGVATAHGMVGSGEITNQSIRSWDIHRDAVGQSELRGAHDDRGPAVKSHQVANESLLHYDIKDGTLGLQDFSQSAKDGLKGDKGAKGDQGPKGNPGVSGYEADGFYTSNNPEDNPDRIGGPVASGGSQQYTAECADGKYALSGGFSNGNTEPGTDLTIRESHPSGFEPIEGDPEGSVKATSWSVTVENETNSEQHAQVFVVCANVN